ncbi:DUF397 domain-containing protein [Actinomadura sp. KC06]|nr:DUF397 domain-containing protein [Actinomadura sp. KC06]
MVRVQSRELCCEHIVPGQSPSRRAETGSDASCLTYCRLLSADHAREDAIHLRGAVLQHRPQLVPVDGLRHVARLRGQARLRALAGLSEGIGVRDSKDPDGLELFLERDEFAALMAVLKH